MNVKHLALSAMAGLAATSLSIASDAKAAAGTFSSQSSFQAAAGALTGVDFNTALSADTGIHVASEHLSLGSVDFSVSSFKFISVRGPKNLDDTGNLLAAGIQYGSPYLGWDIFTEMTITLPYEVRAIGFTYMNLFGFDDGWTFTVSGETFNGTSGPSPEFFGLVSDTAFTQITIGDSEGFPTIDDLAFNVPEPASLALFGFGLAGLAALRRRTAA